MIDQFNRWWETRTVRERWLLGVAAGLAVLVLAWLLIVRPIDLLRESAKARHDHAVIALGRVEARLAEIEEFAANPSATVEGRISDVVMAEAVRVGFNTAQTEPAGTDGVRVLIGAVRPQTFFAWVADLENRLGLDVDALTARPNADETLSVDVTFRRGQG
ncbi:type II secretion system protein GspM [Parasphingopyxis lamellibrachiae]|uniref:Type II secretion system protein M (GspM) n=1 Tax=Parasphingopyxis lamellibrachiae TaxID=680125 RepID=A0A3D9FDQ3_9SPHN|nr:type II secretion system protein GspM [Parasphingopyxis lamellibrachiae]RED15798.1 type II secretion system protein M (GspM) [Parasphingopyxis lamellibrachiae]